MADDTLLTLTADIVSAHVSNNSVAAGDLSTLIERVYDALAKAAAPAEAETPKPVPAVSVRNSVKPDYLVCLEDGKKLTMLKRYLSRNFGLTPDEYRAKWDLPKDYPMVAPNYAERRRRLALEIGLGRKPAKESEIDAPTVEKSPKKRRKLGIFSPKVAEVMDRDGEAPAVLANPKSERTRRAKLNAAAKSAAPTDQ